MLEGRWREGGKKEEEDLNTTVVLASTGKGCGGRVERRI